MLGKDLEIAEELDSAFSKIEEVARQEACDLSDLDIEELTDAISRLNWRYERVTIDDADIPEQLRNEISDETKYLPVSSYEDYSDVQTKAELRKILEDIVEEEIVSLESEYDDIDVYNALSDVFHTEKIAETTLGEGEWMTVSVEKIKHVNKYFIVFEKADGVRAIKISP